MGNCVVKYVSYELAKYMKYLFVILTALVLGACTNPQSPSNEQVTNASPTQEPLYIAGLETPPAQTQDQTLKNVTLIYQPMQCVKTPWTEWLESSNTRFIKTPTDSEVIIAYYGQKGIGVQNIEKINRDIMVCMACEICETTHQFRLIAQEKDLESLQSEGWKLDNQQQNIFPNN